MNMAMQEPPVLPRPTALDALSDEARKRLLSRGHQQDPQAQQRIEETARAIAADVQKRGDAALLEHTERLDGVRPEPHVLGPEAFEAARSAVPPTLIHAMERAAKNLHTVAQKTRGEATNRVDVEPGLTVTEVRQPLGRIGAYAPGGRAAYPSSVLMTIVPAQAAGVPHRIVATPPGPDGSPPQTVLAACAIAGATKCLVAGGAQAIAALAYGTESIERVDKIVGPGNAYVTTAKRIVHGEVATDAPAGPSEVVILADESADPQWLALDLVAQAEHGPDSPCILVTPSRALAETVARLLPETVAEATRSDTVAAALSGHGAILIAKTPDEALRFVNTYAPEHLQIIAKSSEQWADQIETAGTTFLGPWAPVPVGDYLTGANHVLPTGGAGRYSGPLSVHDFLVRRTRQRLDAQAARGLIEDLDTLALAEGLPAHGASLRARSRDPIPLEQTKKPPEGPA